MANDEVKIVSQNLQMVPLAKLHIQYVHNVTPIDLWDYDMSLINSPHVEMLRLIRKHGLNWDILWDTRYVKERRRRRELGMHQWTDEYLKEHIRVRWKTFMSLKEHGFKPKLYQKKKKGERPVVVLEKPFWKTRFGCQLPDHNGYEIWDGGGRCAAACALGWTMIPAKWAVDKYPGSGKKGRFGNKLANIKDVWDFTESRGTYGNPD